MGRECRGTAAVESAKQAFQWVFNNTTHKNIFAVIPEDNRAAQLVANWSGMQCKRIDDGNKIYQIGLCDG